MALLNFLRSIETVIVGLISSHLYKIANLSVSLWWIIWQHEFCIRPSLYIFSRGVELNWYSVSCVDKIVNIWSYLMRRELFIFTKNTFSVKYRLKKYLMKNFVSEECRCTCRTFWYFHDRHSTYQRRVQQPLACQSLEIHFQLYMFVFGCIITSNKKYCPKSVPPCEFCPSTWFKEEQKPWQKK